VRAPHGEIYTTAFMHEGSQRDTQRASAKRRRGWARTAFIGSILLSSALWVSSPCFPAGTDTKSGADPYSQGVVLLTQQKWKQAVGEFQQAIHNDPKNSQAYSGLGVALTRLGNRSEAEPPFNDAIRLDAKNVQAHYYLGLIAAESQDLEVATKELNTVFDVLFHSGGCRDSAGVGLSPG
jgi:tetratricopeptide (TPR) repeat protein